MDLKAIIIVSSLILVQVRMGLNCCGDSWWVIDDDGSVCEKWNSLQYVLLVRADTRKQILLEFAVFFLLTLYLYQMTSERIFEDQLKVCKTINKYFLFDENLQSFFYKKKDKYSFFF